MDRKTSQKKKDTRNDRASRTTASSPRPEKKKSKGRKSEGGATIKFGSRVKPPPGTLSLFGPFQLQIRKGKNRRTKKK